VAGLAVERLEGASWTGFDVELGHLRPPPGTIGGTDPDRAELILLPTNGWPRGATYRVRLTGALTDTLGRPLTEAKTLQWEVPAATGDPGTEAVAYAQAFPLGFDTWNAAGDALSGRFPGGQSHLFQGLWTDPVTGIAHARARWYDARNAAWLSEDPLLDVDSVNLYAFVGWGPHAAVDPLGECSMWEIVRNKHKCRDYFKEGWSENWQEDKNAVSAAVSMLPVAGEIKDFQEAVSGVDVLTGEELTPKDRLITAAAFFVPFVGGGVLREGAQAGLKAVDKASDTTRAASNAVEMAPAVNRLTPPTSASRAASHGRAPPARSADDLVSPSSGGKYDPPCPTPYNCFGAGTLVATVTGLVPIEQIEVGTEVWAYDDQTGEPVLAQVTALHRREVDALWLLTIGGETIETTSEHPFLVVGKGWTEAQYLEAGDLLAISGGEAARLDVVQQVEQKATVYNFEVAGVATYHVGEIGVVVHNCGILPSGIGGTGRNYDEKLGQGLYALIDDSGSVQYIGRGDAPARLARHAASPELGGYRQVELWSNNLTKAQAKGLENILIGKHGGARSVNPFTNLKNRIRSFSPFNPKAPSYRGAVDDELLRETLARLQAARRSVR
jgi:RHS repeat-associated protein